MEHFGAAFDIWATLQHLLGTGHFDVLGDQKLFIYCAKKALKGVSTRKIQTWSGIALLFSRQNYEQIQTMVK